MCACVRVCVSVSVYLCLCVTHRGGGSVALATSKENFHVLKCRPSEMLEDGTVSFLDILSLKYGFQMFDKLGGIDK